MKFDFHYADPPCLPPVTPEAAGWLRECINVLDSQIEALAVMRKLFADVIDSDNAEAGEAAGDPVGPIAPARRTPLIAAVPPDADLTGLDISLEGTVNTLERIIRIAEGAEDKFLNVTQTARYIIKTGHSQATVQNMRVAVQRVFNKHPELFEQVRPATYRYRGGEQLEQAAPSLDILDAA